MADVRAVALSTMWAQQPRFEGTPADFARAARLLGFTHIEINYAMPPAVVEELAGGTVLPVLSVHQPVPRVRHDGRWIHDLNLASLDHAERAAALGAALATIDLAAGIGARAVVLHLGAIGEDVRPEERSLRQTRSRGETGPAGPQLRAALAEWRRQHAPPYLEAARRVLEQLAQRARQRGVVLGLENRLHYHEIPSIEEVALLLADHEPAIVGYWHDVGHAEVTGRLGLVPTAAWLDRFAARTVGSHLHDVDRLADHRAPGEGDVDWEVLAARLPASALRVMEVDQNRPEDALRDGLDLLADLGMV